jgi:hypothetical protein
MRHESLLLLAFAALLAAFDGLLWTYAPSTLAGVLLIPPAVAAALAGGAIARRRARTGDGRRVVPELSFATVLIAIGSSTAALAAIFGLWLLLIGLAMELLGAFGVLRERRLTGEARR